MCANYIIQQCTEALEWTGKQRCVGIRASLRRGTESGGSFKTGLGIEGGDKFSNWQKK